jgi:crotonobetainyl-CoA:carnitine CoA-transferase CaiB-like acyl-CoA transferase
VYRCQGSDDWIAIAARDGDEWRALCRVAGNGWETEPRFADQPSRLAHRAELDAVISAWTAAYDKQVLMHTLLAAGVPAGAVLASYEYLHEPQLEARAYFAELQHPLTGPQRFDGSPLRFNGERGYETWLAAPRLGEHNATLLRDLLGHAGADIARLLDTGVIAERPPQER